MHPRFALRAVLLLGLVLAWGERTEAQAAPPKAVVVVVVDQMRFDFLTRFAPLYEGGLALLSSAGVVYSEAHHEHFFTSTAVGHATIATGVYPSHSGIVSNSWWDREAGENVYAVEDPESPILGRPGIEGRSPRNMLHDAVGDWLKEASPASKVYAVTLKDRSAITLGGRHPDDAYWYDAATGWFVTSAYYRDSLPEWVREFNDDALVDTYYSKQWRRLLPEEAYSASREDGFPMEFDGVHITFPHRLDQLIDSTAWWAADSASQPLSRYPAQYYDELKHTPFGDEVTFAFAERLIEEEEIGRDDAPDLLFVGASAADYIGHRYGPMSQEIEDYYLRLDRMLKEFFEFLDESVGQGNYAVVLTSDHGVVPMPEQLRRDGIDAQRIDPLVRQEIVIPALTVVLGEMEITEQLRGVTVSPYGLVMRFSSSVPERTVVRARRNVAAKLRESPYIADAFAYDDVGETGDDPWRQLYLRSFHPNRAPDVIIRYKEHYLFRMERGGTTHETPYRYDTHVPLVFWGPGLAPGWHDRRVATVDIAPTIAAMLGVSTPDDLDGERLAEVIR